MARNWRDIRAEAIAQGRLDPERVQAANRKMRNATLAERLADVRRARGHARQADLAAIMVNGSIRQIGHPDEVERELSAAYLGG